MATHSKTRTAVQRIRRAARRLRAREMQRERQAATAPPPKTRSRSLTAVDHDYRVIAHTPGLRPAWTSRLLEAARSGSKRGPLGVSRSFRSLLTTLG
jgi:hypothetical protein